MAREHSIAAPLPNGYRTATVRFKTRRRQIADTWKSCASPIHIVAGALRPEIVAWLLDRGVTVDQPDSQTWTPLLMACIAHVSLGKRIDKERGLQTVRLLLGRGANVNDVWPQNQKRCAELASTQVAEYFVQRGAVLTSGT